MASGGKPVEIKPGANSGRLMTGTSSDAAGISNYITKREWRRLLDREVRAEGYEWFRPNVTYDKLIQSTPPGSNAPITVISECILGNGRIAIVAGNKTDLWRYVGLEDPNFYDTENNAAYYDTEGGRTYYADGPAGWIKIGSGFNAEGNRWEAVGVADYLVLNNGVDLPMTYRLDELAVKPIYELREQQIAAVGTIANHAGILVCADISQINDDAFADLMAPIPAAGNAAQDNNGKVTPSAAVLFPSIDAADLVGLTLFWGGGKMRGIRSVDNGFIIVDNDVPIAAGPVSVENSAAYAAYTNSNNIQRYRWRFFPSMPSKPRRFGAVFPIAFSKGDRWGYLSYPVRSIPELARSGAQASFVTTGIGLGAGNLTADIIWTYPGITNTIMLDTTAQTAQAAFNAKDNTGALIEAADAQASFAGVFEDLEDDGGGIIKMLALREQLVIYKDTAVVFIASYTGDLVTPYQFQRVQINEASARLVYRNTVIAGGGGLYGSYHLYAGENAFYKFDLFTMIPVELPALQVCQNLFFENAEDPENCFASDNPNTREVFFVFGSDGPDNAICYDYAYKTCRTTSVSLTAAAKVRHPITRDYWFAMGLPDGSIKRYGLFNPKTSPVQKSGSITATLSGSVVTASANFFTTNHVGKTIIFNNGIKVAVAEILSETTVSAYVVAGQDSAFRKGTLQLYFKFKIIPAIYHRDGQPYDSVMDSGMDAFGFSHGEKQLNEYVLSLSSKSPILGTGVAATPVLVEFKGSVNASDDGDVIQSATMQRPDIQNLLKPTVLHYYLGVRATVSGMNNPIEVNGQLLNIQPVSSHSFGRRPT